MGLDRLPSGSIRARHLEEHIIPALGPRPLSAISAGEIQALFEQVSATVSPAAAERVRATLRELFADAVNDRLVAASPVPARASS